MRKSMPHDTPVDIEFRPLTRNVRRPIGDKKMRRLFRIERRHLSRRLAAKDLPEAAGRRPSGNVGGLN